MPFVDLAPVIVATWPAASEQTVGPFTVPKGAGGGNRVSAIRLTDPAAPLATEAEINAALALQTRLGQTPLFMVLDHQTTLDEQLSKRGLIIRDATMGFVIAADRLAAAPPPVTCFSTWPPLAIQEEIWAEGGIGPARLAVMDRVTGPKISLFGRINDKPAASAFVAVHDGMAMLHALEVAPEHRRHGLAAIVIRAAADWALGVGADRLSVLVTRENKAAQALYASLGFEPMGHYHYRANNP